MSDPKIEALAEALAAELERSNTRSGTASAEAEGPRERVRAMAQGVTFGGADEAEAYLRSVFMGEDYDTALADVRQRLKDYRGERPWEALAYEAGGAALPSIAFAIGTGGAGAASAFPTLARMGALLGAGALEGGAYAFNTGEGGLQNRLDRVPAGMATGAVGAGIGGVAMAGGGAALRSLTDFARRKLGPRAAGVVEREIRKAIEDGDMTLQEAIDGVVNGRILADNRTVASIARAWRAQSSEADAILRRGLQERPMPKRQELLDFVQDRMGASGNARQQFDMDQTAARLAEGAEYDRIFAGAGAVDDDTAAQLVEAFRRVPGASTELDKLFRAQTGRAPFFRQAEDGIVFDRNPTLEEAEIMRRALSTAADREYRAGAGAVGQAYGDVEGAVRSRLDNTSSELAATRQRWSEIERAREMFDLGRRALVNADQAEIDFARAQQAGTNAVEAYRAGVTDALRNKAATGSAQSLPRNILNDERREGRVLRMVFPEDDLDEVLRRAQNADDAQFAVNEVLGGSQTAITQGRLAEQGVSLAEGAFDLAGGGMQAALRLVGQMVRSTNPQLTAKQAAEAARLVVETDPYAVARALSDTTAMDALQNVVEGVTSKFGQVGATAGGAQGGLLSSTFMAQ